MEACNAVYTLYAVCNALKVALLVLENWIHITWSFAFWFLDIGASTDGPSFKCGYCTQIYRVFVL
jgi:hypothetical protein